MSEIISESIYPPIRISHDTTYQKSNTLLHIHDNGFEILLFISGNVKFFIETSIYNLESGDVLLIPPNTLHGYSTKNDYVRIPLHIQQNLLLSLSTKETSLTKAFLDPEHRIIHLNETEMKHFIKYADAIIQLEKDRPYGHDILSRSYLQFLLLIVNYNYRNSFCTAKNIAPNVIQNAIGYITLHLTEDLTVQGIADALSISNSRLTHLFKEHTGSSVWNYVILNRLLLSRSLLTAGKTVMEACLESGFQNYAHFNKAFSKAFGIPPGKFLKEFQRNDITGS